MKRYLHRSNGIPMAVLGWKVPTDMIKDFKSFARIFTILARGYLFHNADGSLKDGDPRGMGIVL